MKLIHFFILPLMCIGLACGADHKAETAAAVKLLEERSILKQDVTPFYTAFQKYQKGKAKITDFPFLSYLTDKDDKKNRIPQRVWTAFIDAGADVNATYNIDTPLYHASKLGNDDLVKALLDAGADVNAKDEFGYTLLHKARKEAVVKTLIAAGADVNAKDKWKRTPLHKAIDMGHVTVAEALIAAGAE